MGLAQLYFSYSRPTIPVWLPLLNALRTKSTLLQINQTALESVQKLFVNNPFKEVKPLKGIHEPSYLSL